MEFGIWLQNRHCVMRSLGLAHGDSGVRLIYLTSQEGDGMQVRFDLISEVRHGPRYLAVPKAWNTTYHCCGIKPALQDACRLQT